MSKRKTTEEFIAEAISVKGEGVYDYSKVEYKNSKTPVIIRCLKHDYIFFQRPNDHLRGQGCPLCGDERREQPRKTLDDYKVEGYDYSLSEYKSSSKKIKVICNNENHKGFVFKIRPSDLKRGHGCPECKKEKLRKTTEEFINEAIKIHGNKYDYSFVDYRGTDIKVKIFCKKCNKYFLQTPHLHLMEHGCEKCIVSKGEERIEEILENKNIKYFLHKTFDDLRYKKKLSYDFYLPDYNLLIEYNGAQHYESIEYFGGVERFKLQQTTDNIKKEYARERGIKLLEIHYKDFKNLNEILDKALSI